MSSKALCPVMILYVDKKVARSKRMVRKFQGETIYLCCPSCVELFDKNPSKYASKINRGD